MTNNPEFKDTNVAKISHLVKNWHQPVPGSEKRAQVVLYQQGVITTSYWGNGQLAKMQMVFDKAFVTREGIESMVSNAELISNPATFLGASARVAAPKCQVATNLSQVLLG